MDQVKKQHELHYAATHDDAFDIFIDVELSNDMFLPDEEQLIDRLMMDFNQKYKSEMMKIRERFVGAKKL